MIRVLKKGTKTARVCECDCCGTILAYYENDIRVKTERTVGFDTEFGIGFTVGDDYIRCPMCDEEIMVSEDDITLSEYKKLEEERGEKNDRVSDTTSDKTGN